MTNASIRCYKYYEKGNQGPILRTCLNWSVSYYIISYGQGQINGKCKFIFTKQPISHVHISVLFSATVTVNWTVRFVVIL